MNRMGALAVLLAIAGALALRLPQLDLRPLHNDEAVNAVKVTELWQQHRYAYDPDEYHGPSLHYASLPFLWLSGAGDADHLRDSTMRLVTVAFGVGLILLLLLFADGLGWSAIGWVAVFTAISPAMVFYSRYFIHEMPLVFFTALTLGAGWRYSQTRQARWAILAGIGIGLMWATKETFVFSVGAMAFAAAVTAVWNARGLKALSVINWKHIALGVLATLTIWLILFSSCFTNWNGLADSFRTYAPWIKRAGGHSPHIHPWYFYFERLAWFHPAKSPIWSEALILLLAVIGAGVSLIGKKSALHKFLALYTIVLAAIYCVISYKTPWCLLSFYFGMILLAGIGAVAVVEFFKARTAQIITVGVLLALSAQLTCQAWKGSFVYASEIKNPYVYAQTVPDLLKLVDKVEGIARVAPEHYDTVVKIVAPGSDYWPLPWYLRRFQHIGYYEAVPPESFAPIMIVSAQLNARLDEKSDKKWIMAGISELRPKVFLELYVELGLWKKYVATLPRED
jgi:uncharacterized protein (TIGR03663 family)